VQARDNAIHWLSEEALDLGRMTPVGALLIPPKRELRPSPEEGLQAKRFGPSEFDKAVQTLWRLTQVLGAVEILPSLAAARGLAAAGGLAGTAAGVESAEALEGLGAVERAAAAEGSVTAAASATEEAATLARAEAAAAREATAARAAAAESDSLVARYGRLKSAPGSPERGHEMERLLRALGNERRVLETPYGPRVVDAHGPGFMNLRGKLFDFEAKMYKGSVSIGARRIREELLKDLWLMRNRSDYSPFWLFTDAEPTPALARVLHDLGIPFQAW